VSVKRINVSAAIQFGLEATDVSGSCCSLKGRPHTFVAV
jgi:hypothetical protein